MRTNIKSTSTVKSVGKVTASVKAAAVEIERLQFRQLLAINPNHFGNAIGSKLPVAKALSGNTNYEELTCVGFQPQINELEAVIKIKRSSGYGGDLCDGGSEEYVRFYTSDDNGATWVDRGLVQFSAYDIAHTGALDYGVALHADIRRKLCTVEHLLLVRAILSWNQAPPANMPNWKPVWGNVREATILVEPRRYFVTADFADFGAKIPAGLKIEKPDFEMQFPIPEPDPIGPIELQKLYAKSNVPPERYLFKEIAQAGKLSAKAATLSKIPLEFLPLKELKIDPAVLGKAFSNIGDGNKTYEELPCVGYDAEADALVGIVHLKKASGYSGKQCNGGSTEYVAWWLDWGTGWEYAGTSSVRVYDTTAMPTDGLRYAVHMPLNTAAKRKSCSSGGVFPKIRAILSWQVAPSTSNPNWVPTWGDRTEGQGLLTPGAVQSLRPILESISGVAVCGIDPSIGKTYAPALQPFGRVLTITGFIPDAPDISVPAGEKLKYRIQVREYPGGSWQTVSNTFGITVTEQIGAALPTQYGISQSVDADGYYTYQEDMNTTGAGYRLVLNRVLAQWITAKPMTGLWEIKVDVYDPVGDDFYAAQSVLCSDGTTRSTVRVHLDNDPPVCSIAITGFQRGGGPIQPAAPCGTFRVGDVLHGTYSVSDEHFGGLSMAVLPASAANGATTVPNSRTFPAVPTVGENGTWTLNTAGMDPCGFVVYMAVNDRTIEGTGGWDASDSVGFCLKGPGNN